VNPGPRGPNPLRCLVFRVDHAHSFLGTAGSNLMSRFCIRHSHRGSSRAYRMVLARHSLDRPAEQQVVDEHGDCAQCWEDTAVALADAAHGLLIRLGPLPEMDRHGIANGPTIDWLLGWIDDLLECEAADRRDLERGA
jgi:hypothetical protein